MEPTESVQTLVSGKSKAIIRRFIVLISKYQTLKYSVLNRAKIKESNLPIINLILSGMNRIARGSENSTPPAKESLVDG